MSDEEPTVTCPFSGCGWVPGYPSDYRDPPFERTGDVRADSERFKVVVDARREAITGMLNAHLAEVHDDVMRGMRFEWKP